MKKELLKLYKEYKEYIDELFYGTGNYDKSMYYNLEDFMEWIEYGFIEIH